MSKITDPRQMAKIAVEALEDKKAEDIRIIDISEISTIADYFIIASGNNRNQVQTLCDNVDEMLSKSGVERRQCEGYDGGNWVLSDYRDLVVHIFDKENRLFYDIERIWRDGKQIELSELMK